MKLGKETNYTLTFTHQEIMRLRVAVTVLNTFSLANEISVSPQADRLVDETPLEAAQALVSACEGSLFTILCDEVGEYV